MPKYFLTFGVQYKQEPHPHVPTINPDGYVVVDAVSELEAREKVFNIFGDKWAFLYPEKSWSEKNAMYFPLGQVATLEEIEKQNLDTFYCNAKKVPVNSASIISEKELSETLTPTQLMVMNNVSKMFSRLSTFPRVDKYEKEIDETMQNIKAGLGENNDGDISDIKRITLEMIEIVRSIK